MTNKAIGDLGNGEILYDYMTMDKEKALYLIEKLQERINAY